ARCDRAVYAGTRRRRGGGRPPVGRRPDRFGPRHPSAAEHRTAPGRPGAITRSPRKSGWHTPCRFDRPPRAGLAWTDQTAVRVRPLRRPKKGGESLRPSAGSRGTERTMNRLRWLLACGLLALVPCVIAAPGWRPCTWYRLQHLNARLHGTVLDFTHNHGADHRIYSPALGHPRDLYVYLPPGFDPHRAYPVMIQLHGIAQDEQFFLRTVEVTDRAIACGRLPPLIIAVPDGSIRGKPTTFIPGSFFLNTKAGRF